MLLQGIDLFRLPYPAPQDRRKRDVARYFELITQQGTVSRVAWTYENPTQTFTPIAGYIAFYAGKVDEAWVGDVKVIPQPGDFYGGWVTPNLEGRIKGALGTNHW